MFSPLRTERLVLRPARPDDAEALAARRSEPAVARYQDWQTPYPVERARDLLAAISARSGPVPDQWWMLVIADPDDAVTYGDLALLLGDEGRTAEIGYSLAGAHWGHGLATEAVGALLDWLFDAQGVRRVQARIHPDNIASAHVLERLGFAYEGRTRLSYDVGTEIVDDVFYGLVAAGRDAWRQRPTEPPTSVELVVLDAGNQRDVGRLETHWSQRRFVAPVTVSLADYAFPEVVDGYQVVPWARGVRADGEWAGFVMLALRSEHHDETFLWRLLIERNHQRRGIGRRVLDTVVDDLRRRGERSLATSWVEGRGSPAPFYLAYGFEPTGREIDGETEARLSLG